MADTLRQFALKWTRTLHVYLTMAGLLLLVFFCVTGFMLNHPDWFGLEDVRTSSVEGSLPTAILAEPDKLAVAERLRARFGAAGAVESFETDDQAVRVVFSGPGRRTQATIDRADGKAQVTTESHGVVGLLTDLHKGKASGAAWGVIIDATAALLLLVSLTGLYLWTSLPKRRALGLAAAAVGGALGTLVYLLAVP